MDWNILTANPFQVNQGKCSARFWRIIHRQVEYKENSPDVGMEDGWQWKWLKWREWRWMSQELWRGMNNFQVAPLTSAGQSILSRKKMLGWMAQILVFWRFFACDVPPDKVSFAESKWWRPRRFTLRWSALSLSVHMARWLSLAQAKKMDVDSVMKRSRMLQKNAWSQESRDTLQGLQGLHHGFMMFHVLIHPCIQGWMKIVKTQATK